MRRNPCPINLLAPPSNISAPLTPLIPTRLWPTFADDAYVNDAQREIVGIGAIRRWIEKEITGEHVTIAVREVVNHHGDPIVRGVYDGDYDKTGLPKELILTSYFKILDGKIVSLIIVFNKPSPLHRSAAKPLI